MLTQTSLASTAPACATANCTTPVAAPVPAWIAASLPRRRVRNRHQPHGPASRLCQRYTPRPRLRRPCNARSHSRLHTPALPVGGLKEEACSSALFLQTASFLQTEVILRDTNWLIVHLLITSVSQSIWRSKV